MFSNYLECYLKSAESYDFDKVSKLNDLFKTVFKKIDLSTFFTLEDFRDYYIKNIFDLNNLEDEFFMMNFFEEYARRGTNIHAQVTNLSGELEWTNTLLKIIYMTKIPILMKQDVLEKFSNSITFVIENSELEKKSINILKNLKTKMNSFAESLTK